MSRNEDNKENKRQITLFDNIEYSFYFQTWSCKLQMDSDNDNDLQTCIGVVSCMPANISKKRVCYIEISAGKCNI